MEFEQLDSEEDLWALLALLQNLQKVVFSEEGEPELLELLEDWSWVPLLKNYQLKFLNQTRFLAAVYQTMKWINSRAFLH